MTVQQSIVAIDGSLASRSTSGAEMSSFAFNFFEAKQGEQQNIDQQDGFDMMSRAEEVHPQVWSGQVVASLDLVCADQQL